MIGRLRLGIVRQYFGWHFYFFLPATCCWTNSMFASRIVRIECRDGYFCFQQPITGCGKYKVFALRHCQSHTNVKLDASLHVLGCSNWENSYSNWLGWVFDVSIAVHHCQWSQSVICLPSELSLMALLLMDRCHCRPFSLEWVPWLLAPKFWWSLWLLLP